MTPEAIAALINSADDPSNHGAGFALDLWLAGSKPTEEPVTVTVYHGTREPIIGGALVVASDGRRPEAMIACSSIIAARINWAPGPCLFEGDPE